MEVGLSKRHMTDFADLHTKLLQLACPGETVAEMKAELLKVVEGMTQLAEQGDIDAMITLADLQTGRVAGHLNLSLKDLWRWYEKAAKIRKKYDHQNKDEYALYRLAELYLSGEFVKQDEAKAQEYIQELLKLESPYGYLIEGRRLYDRYTNWSHTKAEMEGYFDRGKAFGYFCWGVDAARIFYDDHWLLLELEDWVRKMMREGYPQIREQS